MERLIQIRNAIGIDHFERHVFLVLIRPSQNAVRRSSPCLPGNTGGAD